jgi:sodium/proline symporter
MSLLGIIAAFLIYFAGMLAIGFYFSNKSKNLSDYVLGGRGLGKWVIAMSAQASDMSGWLLMGLPGLAYVSGFAEPFWVAAGLALGTYLNWRFIAKRLRLYTEAASDSLTISDFFENRFQDDSHVLRTLSSIFIIVFFTVYTSSGFIAAGKLFETIFSISYIWALIIGSAILVAYTFMGGFFAVCWTDFIQGIMMFGAALFVPLVTVHALGGFSSTAVKISAISPTVMSLFNDVKGHPLSAIVILSSVSWGLGYFGMPHILVRFMAIKKPNELKDSRRIAMVWVLISLASAVLVGVIGHVFTSDHLLVGNASETIFMVIVQSLFISFLAGVMLSAILAAIMSTAASQLLVAASGLTGDFYKAFLHKKASSKAMVRAGRFSVMLISLIAFIIALKPDSSIFKVVSFAWAGLGSTFGPVILCSLFWKRTTALGALAGIFAGGVTVILWKYFASLGGIFNLYEIVPGFFVSIACIIIVSLVSKAPSRVITDKFEEVRKKMKA